MEVSTVFSTEEINRQLKLILDFPLFKTSAILSRFLEFIVEETLHNRELHIKEYSIAINVLHRSRDFNPNGDSIVRIHAGRLRRVLNEYYLTKGIYDPIIIQIPKGSYVPEFAESGTVKKPAERMPVRTEQGNKPIIAIFPFRATTNTDEVGEFLEVLEGQLSSELLKSPDIAVIGYYSKTMVEKIKENILEAGKSAGADYIITGSLTYTGQHIRILIKLLVTGTGEVLLCKSFERSVLPGDLLGIQDNIVQNFLSFASGSYGMLLQKYQCRAF